VILIKVYNFRCKNSYRLYEQRNQNVAKIRELSLFQRNILCSSKQSCIVRNEKEAILKIPDEDRMSDILS